MTKQGKSGYTRVTAGRSGALGCNLPRIGRAGPKPQKSIKYQVFIR